MNKLLTTFWAVLVTAVSIGVMAWLYWDQKIDWPAFSSDPVVASSPTPEVVAYIERDYGWRTGDVIPVTMFIKEKPGTEVDTNTLAIEGDFEVVGNVDIFTRDLKDGSRLIKITMHVQSFNVKKQLTLKSNMSYRLDGSQDDILITLPAVDPYTSMTYDGERKLPQEGPKTPLHDWHLFKNVGMLLASIAGIAFFVGLIRRFNRETDDQGSFNPSSPREIARRDFDIAWKKLMLFDFSQENFKEIERIIRRLFRIESRTLREIDFELGQHPFRAEILHILAVCSKVLYQGQSLDDAELDSIKSTFDKIVPPRRQPAQAPKRA